MSGGYNISKGRACFILLIWIAITIAIALMVAYIPDHSCDSEQASPTTTESPSLNETSTTQFPPQGDGPWMNPFLEELIRPIHYELYLDPDFYHDGNTFKGRENITIDVGMNTQHLIVHYKYMNITNTRVWHENTELAIEETFSYDNHEYWVTSLSEGVSPGTQLVLHLEFEGSLVNGIVGYYKSTYVNADTGEESWMSTTKFQPTDARKAFPNFDEPQYKANFTITQRHWQNFTALSNMPVASETILDDTWQETTFETSVKMSSYLVCFIVCDFAYKTNTLTNGKQHRMWATPDKIDQVDYSLSITKDLMEYFENEFAMEYHLPKLDQVAVPDYPSGATEHWGLITYRESRLLYDENEAGASDKQGTAEIVAHELAHNMFGNIITCKWWKDIWLNEGFATYLSLHSAHENVKTTSGQADHFVPGVMQPMMASDADASSRAITEDVTHPDEINQAFSGVVYSKGASILRMVDHFMGGTKFRDALRVLLERHEYGSVTTDDLWEVFQEQMGDSYNIKAMMDPWVEQMGLPVITITQNDNKLELKQSRFLNDPDADPSLPESPFEYKWYVPLTYKTPSMSSEELVWLNMTDAIIDDPRQSGEWIKFNHHEFGYFRVNYDAKMWDDLSQQLLTDHHAFSEVDRSNIIDDAFNLARATHLDYPVALNLTTYLDREEHYFPWRSVGLGLSYISSQLYSDENFGDWRAYMQTISTPMMDKLGIEEKDDDTHLDKLNREYIIIPLSCGHGYEECLLNTTRLFVQWLQNETFEISPDLRRSVYRYGMQQTGGDDAWDTVWQRYQRASGAERDNLAYCLAQTDRIWLLRRYVEYAMDPTLIRTQDFFTVINYIAANRNANRYLWDWTRAHYDELIERFGVSDRYFGQMVPDMVSSYNTEFHLNEVLEFYAKYPDAGAGAGPREESIASIEANIAWMSRNRDDIIDWLQHNHDLFSS